MRNCNKIPNLGGTAGYSSSLFKDGAVFILFRKIIYERVFVMSEKTTEIRQAFEDALAKVTNIEELEKLRVEYIGKKGFVTELLKEIGE